jgi:hypothetical protein
VNVGKNQPKLGRIQKTKNSTMRQVLKDTLLKVEKHLDTSSDQLIKELTTIIEGDWGLSTPTSGKKVALLDIEVFIDGYRLVLYPMNKESTQLGYRSLLDEVHPYGILNDDAFNPDYDSFDFENDDDNNDLVEFEKLQKDTFINWFVSCWNKIDSSKLSIPIYLCFHDSFNSLDLKKNKWTKDK